MPSKNGSEYDAALREKLKDRESVEQLFLDLALEDITRAADLFRTIHDGTSGVDGWVSLEVSPLLAHDTVRTISAAKELFGRADRPNLFIRSQAPGKVYRPLRKRPSVAFR